MVTANEMISDLMAWLPGRFNEVGLRNMHEDQVRAVHQRELDQKTPLVGGPFDGKHVSQPTEVVEIELPHPGTQPIGDKVLSVTLRAKYVREGRTYVFRGSTGETVHVRDGVQQTMESADAAAPR